MTPPVILPADAPREQWEHARMSGLGGSDIAAAAGLNPWKTSYALWLEKTGRVAPDFDDVSRERMRWGNVLEPVLLREFDERHDELILTGGDGIYAHRERDWQLGNVDALAWTPDGELDAIVECKTGSHRQLARWEGDAVPSHYVAQVQWYMSILDAPRAIMVALLDTSTYVERVVMRDDELITDLLEAGAYLWSHVLCDEPPPVDGSAATRAALARRIAEPDDAIELDPLWDKHITRRRELSDMIAALVAQRDVIDNSLRAAMGAAELATRDGETVASHRAPRKPSRTTAYDRLAERWPQAYAECVTERTTQRRLTYRKENGSSDD